jgi:hypothetical protein
MAATNFTPIQLYFSTTASAVPTAANLAQGELAININDGKLYYEDSTGVVQVIATKGAGTIGGSTTQIQYNNAGALAGNAAMVFNSGTSTTTLTTLNLTNALGAIYGGTAQSTYAQGDIVYASAANTLAKLGIGTTNYILTSTGAVPQWVAPSSIAVLTATNLAGGLAGSVPYQSALDTTTFLAIGAANRVMTSTGTAPQWVTALTGLTGVSSSSITDTGLTSGRVTFASTSGLLADSASLTFNGTTLTTAGLSNSGFSTLVKTLTLGDTSFNGTAVFAAATPAKLYMGTGTVTDVTSAISATNTTGAIASLAITPIAATNTGVTYTNASTLYIAGAPSAGTNVTITNPYSLYVAGGAVNLGGNTAVTGTLSATGAATIGNGVSCFNNTTGSVALRIGVGTNSALTTGAGLDVSHSIATGTTSVVSIDRAATYTILSLDGSAVNINVAGTPKAAISSTALALQSGVSLTGGTSGTGYSFSGSAPATSLTLDASGNLGIGTTTPDIFSRGYGRIVGINDSGSSGAALEINSASSYSAVELGRGGVRKAFFTAQSTATEFGNLEAVPLLFYTNSTERARIDSSGNLGIGTTSPAYKLEVRNDSATAYNPSTAALNTILSINNQSNGASKNALMAFTTELNGEWYIGGVQNAGNTAADFVFVSRASGARAERMRLDSSGNLGLGVTPTGTSGFSANKTFEIGGASALAIIFRPSGSTSEHTVLGAGDGLLLGATGAATASNNAIRFFTSNTNSSNAPTERARIDSSGNLLVGVTSGGSGTLRVSGGKDAFISPYSAPSAGYFYSSNSTDANCVEIFQGRYDKAGLVLSANNTGTQTQIAFYEGGSSVGSVTTTTLLTAYNTTSDYRLKTVIGAVSDSGSRIDALQPIEYTWNSNGSSTRGFLAHQFQEVYAGSVTGTKDAVDADGKPMYQAMQASTSEVIADLVAELQSLRARVAQLESKP